MRVFAVPVLILLLCALPAHAGNGFALASVYNLSGRNLAVREAGGHWTPTNGAALPRPGLVISGDKGFQPFNARLEPGERAWIRLERADGGTWTLTLASSAEGEVACEVRGDGTGPARPLVQRIGALGGTVLFDVSFKPDPKTGE